MVILKYLATEIPGACLLSKVSDMTDLVLRIWKFLNKFYQELLKENSNPRLKENRKGIIVKGKEFYIPILNTFPTR